MQNSPAQSVGRYWRHPARQDLLKTHGISAQSIGGCWRHPARQCLRCMWDSPARSIGRCKLLSLVAQSVALCPVATWSHYALPCSSRLLSFSLSDCVRSSLPFSPRCSFFISAITIAACLATGSWRPPINLLISTLEAASPLISPTHSVGHTGATSLHI